MSVNTSRAVQRVLNELADEGIMVQREIVERSVENATDTDTVVMTEDELVDYVFSAIRDAAEHDLLGETLPEGDHGGILLSEEHEFDFDDR